MGSEGFVCETKHAEAELKSRAPRTREETFTQATESTILEREDNACTQTEQGDTAAATTRIFSVLSETVFTFEYWEAKDAIIVPISNEDALLGSTREPQLQSKFARESTFKLCILGP